MMEKFRYTLPGGYTVEVPRFENVSAGLIRKTRKLNPADQAFTILEAYLSEGDLEQHIDPLTRDEFEAFLKAWQSGSTVTPGESSASSTS